MTGHPPELVEKVEQTVRAFLVRASGPDVAGLPFTARAAEIGLLTSEAVEAVFARIHAEGLAIVKVPDLEDRCTCLGTAGRPHEPGCPALTNAAIRAMINASGEGG